MAGIASNSIVFLGRQYALLFFALARSMILAQILGQSDYNYWVLFQVFFIYIDLTHLGLRQVVSREIPILKGEARDQEAAACGQAVYGGTLILSVSAAFILLIAGLLFQNHILEFDGYDSNILASGLFVATVLLISEQVYRYFLTLLRTRHKFIKISIIEISYEITKTVLVCGMAYKYAAVGGMSGFAFTALLAALLFVAFERIPKPVFRFSDVQKVLQIGIPLFFASLSNILVISIDRILGSAILAPEILSLYGLAASLGLLPVYAIQSLRDVLFPSFGELSSTITTDEKFGALFSKALRISVILAPVMSMAMLLVMEPAIVFLVPKFTNAVDILYYLVGAAVILAAGAIPNSVLIVLRKQWIAFWISAGTCATLILILNVLNATLLDELTALIVSVWIAFLVYTITSIWYSFRMFLQWNLRQKAGFTANLVKSVLPFVIGLLVVYELRTSFTGTWALQYLIQIAVFIASSVWIILGNKDLLPELTSIAKRVLPGLKV